MVNIKVLALLAIVFCFTFQSQASPLTLRELNDGEETDREFEDAFEEAMNEEVAREFENVNKARNFEDDDEEAQTLQEDARMETDREFEDAFAKAIQEEVARNFENEEAMNFREDDPSEGERQIYADFDITPKKDEVSQDAQQFEDEQQISADFDITPANEDEERQEPVPVPESVAVHAPVSEVKPRTTKPLRLSQLFIRPVLIKRCQGKANHSLEHCAKYLSCGTIIFRGVIRICESGQLFDAVLKECNDSDKVDCNIRT